MLTLTTEHQLSALSAQVQGSAKRAVLAIARAVTPSAGKESLTEAGKDGAAAAAVGGAEEKGTDG